MPSFSPGRRRGPDLPRPARAAVPTASSLPTRGRRGPDRRVVPFPGGAARLEPALPSSPWGGAALIAVSLHPPVERHGPSRPVVLPPWGGGSDRGRVVLPRGTTRSARRPSSLPWGPEPGRVVLPRRYPARPRRLSGRAVLPGAGRVVFQVGRYYPEPAASSFRSGGTTRSRPRRLSGRAVLPGAGRVVFQVGRYYPEPAASSFRSGGTTRSGRVVLRRPAVRPGAAAWSFPVGRYGPEPAASSLPVGRRGRGLWRPRDGK